MGFPTPYTPSGAVQTVQLAANPVSGGYIFPPGAAPLVSVPALFQSSLAAAQAADTTWGTQVVPVLNQWLGYPYAIGSANATCYPSAALQNTPTVNTINSSYFAGSASLTAAAGPVTYNLLLKTTTDGAATLFQVPVFWNNENAFNGLVSFGWQIGWPVAPNTGISPPNWAGNMPASWEVLPGTGTFAPTPGNVPIFADRTDIKQLMIGVNAIVLPTGFDPSLWQFNTSFGGWFQVPQFYVAFGLKIVEWDDFPSRNGQPLAQSPFFYPGDAVLTQYTGTQLSPTVQITDSPAGAGIGNHLYEKFVHAPAPSNQGPYWRSYFACNYIDPLANYIIPAQVHPDPTIQAPNLIPGFIEGNPTTISDVNGSFTVDTTVTTYTVVPNGRLVPNGVEFFNNPTGPFGFPYPSGKYGVTGKYQGPIVQIPMTGTKSYSLYLPAGLF